VLPQLRGAPALDGGHLCSMALLQLRQLGLWNTGGGGGERVLGGE
jgi:hypothetical protein